MRRHDVDWLRNLAILYLFPFHTARIFDSWETFYVEGHPHPITTDLVQASYWFMPLLFMVAGMSSNYALRRRTPREFLRERTSRLLVPFLFGAAILVPPQAFLALRFHTGESPGYLAFLGGYYTDWSDLSGYRGTFTPAHLWFILFLFLISLGLLPTFRRLASVVLPGWWRHPVGLVLPALGLALLSVTPDIGGKNILVYAGFVLLGFLLAGDEKVLEAIARRRRGYGVATLGGLVAILTVFHTIGWQDGYSPTSILITVGYFTATWLALLAFVGYGRTYLDRPSRVMSYLNGAAFPVYVVHQTLLVALGYTVVGWAVPSGIQFAVILLGSLAASLLAYEVARKTPGLRFLLGIKAAARSRPARAPFASSAQAPYDV
ncbi:MAG: acyltransferase family protein [Demequinaceae bacterium]|nr:acyltransferase family protein [Demequinaceae bacterium]